MFGAVVNAYFKPEHPLSVQMSALFAVSLLLNCPEVTTVVLVDGSAQPSDALESFCTSHGVAYVHAGRSLSFPEAYNMGAARLTEDWVALVASDVYVLPNTFADFKRFIDRNEDRPIGCLIPYLSQSDFRVQEGLVSRARIECRVPTMTINLNVFRRGVYQDVGGLSEDYSGNYNDVYLGIRLKEKGLDTFLIDAYAYHYGSLTLKYGSDTNLERDEGVFFRRRPELENPLGLWSIRFDRLFESRRLRWLYRAATAFKSDTLQSRAVPWILDHVARYQRLR